MKPGRIACEVPFCKRTAPAKLHESVKIICGKHSQLADARVLRIYRKARRRHRRDPNDEAAIRIMIRMWERIREQAIQRAGGI